MRALDSGAMILQGLGLHLGLCFLGMVQNSQQVWTSCLYIPSHGAALFVRLTVVDLGSSSACSRPVHSTPEAENRHAPVA